MLRQLFIYTCGISRGYVSEDIYPHLDINLFYLYLLSYLAYLL